MYNQFLFKKWVPYLAGLKRNKINLREEMPEKISKYLTNRPNPTLSAALSLVIKQLAKPHSLLATVQENSLIRRKRPSTTSMSTKIT